MDPNVSSILQSLSSCLPFEKNAQPPIELYYNLNDSAVSRIAAYRSYEALRQAGLVDGKERNISYAAITGRPPLKFGESAGIFFKDKALREHELVLNFGQRTLDQIKEGINSLLARQMDADSAPSRLADTVGDFERIAQASGVKVKKVEAQGNDIVITSLTASTKEEEKVTNLCQIMLGSGLQSTEDARFIPITTRTILPEETPISVGRKCIEVTRIPLAGKSMEDIQRGLYETEVQVRDMNPGLTWQNKLSSPENSNKQPIRQ